MKEFYTIDVAGLKRDLPLCPLSDDLYIGAFVIFGDVELTEVSAKALLDKAPDFDILVTAESKGIPLAHEMARQSGKNTYVLARKAPKLYMKNVIKVEVKSITTAKVQTLYIDEEDEKKLRGKRVLIVDDDADLSAIVARYLESEGFAVMILAEGDAIGLPGISYVQKLPLFDRNGDPIPVKED